MAPIVARSDAPVIARYCTRARYAATQRLARSRGTPHLSDALTPWGRRGRTCPQPGSLGPVLVVSLIVFVAIWAATQWTAWRLGYQPQLGEPWLQVGSLRLYAPPAFFLGWYWLMPTRRRFHRGGGHRLVRRLRIHRDCDRPVGVRAQEAKEAVTYGSARWATAREVQTAGLLGPDGVILGRLGRAYLRHDGPEHVLCFAPTRSGKGVGLVVPTLLTWPGSSIVHDIKGENWRLTAGWRARFGRVLLFDRPTPTAPRTIRCSKSGAATVRDVQNVADILVDPEGALERRNHWEKTSHSPLVGVILHVLYAEADKTLAGVAELPAPASPSASSPAPPCP